MTYDAGSRQDVRRAEKAAKLAATNDHEVLSGLMSAAPGRAWMHRWLEKLHIFQTPFNPDHGVMAFNCGEQNTGLQLLAGIMASCPDQYVLMMREANERNSNERHTSGERSSGEDGDGRDKGPTDSSGGDETGGEA